MAHIVRIPAEKSKDTPWVLCQVDASTGPNLALNLVATDGNDVYMLSLNQKEIASLRPRSSSSSKEDWEAALAYVFLGRAATDEGTTRGLEVAATVNAGKTCEIVIRRRTEDITQRLGAITLKLTEDEPVELFDWCVIALEKTNDSARELAKLRSKHAEQDLEITRLKQQLATLTAAKEEHENALLKKFQVLLNSKKSKIRDQQRLLASATVDPDKLAQVEAARTKQSTGSVKRGTKRNHNPEPEVDSGAESDDIGEPMDVDADILPGSDAETIGVQSDTDTTEEDDYEESIRDQRAASFTPATSEPARDIDSGEKTPPRRTLPFARRGASAAGRPAPLHEDGDETESDEEL